MAEPIADPNEDTRTQSILLAASHHDLEYLRTLLRSGSANVQDAENGYTPLHAAIAACETLSDVPNNDVSTNGHSTNVAEDHNNITPDPTAYRDAAIKTVKLLLQNGAIWNDLGKNNETPGCLALRLGIKDLYDLMVDAGVRAEMLLSRLDEYEQLADDDDDDDDDDDEADVTEPSNQEGNEGEGQECTKPNREEPVQDAGSTGESQNHLYLNSSLRFQNRRILDDDDNGVMMAWETDIMKRTADVLASRPGLRILNIGHGMGIIDTFFQSNSPYSHHIVEAHPGVLARMREEGWYDKPGVTIHEGRWQDIVPSIIEQTALFDAIYFDTFAESYTAFRDFFSDCIIGLLDDGGKFSFFNGLGADRQICYDVYGKVVEMDLFEAGFEVRWEVVPVGERGGANEWEGVRRRYWGLSVYRLPICEFMS